MTDLMIFPKSKPKSGKPTIAEIIEQKAITATKEQSSTTDIYPINTDYRFRRHNLKCEFGNVTIWDLQKRRKKKGAEVWEFVANDRSPIRLGLYCARCGILPEAENAEALSRLAYE